jgi:hypothetical protein
VFEDTKGVIRIHKSKKDRQHNGQKKKDNQRSTWHTHRAKDRVTRTPLKTGGRLRCSRKISSSCSPGDTRRVTLVTNPMISHERGKTGKCLQQVEHIHGHLWHRCSVIHLWSNEDNIQPCAISWSSQNMNIHIMT